MRSKEQIPAARLHIVTGKGGVGKTTVATALALALASGGHRVLLIEVEGRQGIASLLGRDPMPYADTRITPPGSDGEVYALAVDVEAALMEYLEMFYHLGRAGGALRKLGAVDFATTIAPGLRDVLLTGKVKEAVTRSKAGKKAYDAVVLDAPPTGRIGRFLNVTAEVSGLAKVGPIKTQSDAVSAVLRSGLSTAHIVALPEEMPVTEAIETATELDGLGIAVGSLILNNLRSEAPGARRTSQAGLSRGLAALGTRTDKALLAGLVDEVKVQNQRLELQQDLYGRLQDTGREVASLPRIAAGIDLAALRELAGQLREQGLTL